MLHASFNRKRMKLKQPPDIRPVPFVRALNGVTAKPNRFERCCRRGRQVVPSRPDVPNCHPGGVDHAAAFVA
jgi:hypothetical protein